VVTSSYLSGSILPHSEGGTYTGGYAWYIFRRSCLVHIQAIMPGIHSGGHAWYILARSMTNSPPVVSVLDIEIVPEDLILAKEI